VVFAPAYGSPFVMDLDKGRRYGTIEDFRNFVKLAQSSPWLHHSGGTICEPVDVPVNKRHLDMVYSHIKYSDRAFHGVGDGGKPGGGVHRDGAHRVWPRLRRRELA
jgi:trimethylamine--corrinoid protein Co-methyltransferase